MDRFYRVCDLVYSGDASNNSSFTRAPQALLPHIKLPIHNMYNIYIYELHICSRNRHVYILWLTQWIYKYILLYVLTFRIVHWILNLIVICYKIIYKYLIVGTYSKTSILWSFMGNKKKKNRIIYRGIRSIKSTHN